MLLWENFGVDPIVSLRLQVEFTQGIVKTFRIVERLCKESDFRDAHDKLYIYCLLEVQCVRASGP